MTIRAANHARIEARRLRLEGRTDEALDMALDAINHLTISLERAWIEINTIRTPPT